MELGNQLLALNGIFQLYQNTARYIPEFYLLLAVLGLISAGLWRYGGKIGARYGKALLWCIAVVLVLWTFIVGRVFLSAVPPPATRTALESE